MTVHFVTPILNVSDVPASLAWFEALGGKRSFTWNPTGNITRQADEDANGRAVFAGLRSAHAEIMRCQDGQGGRGETGAWMSWWVEIPAAVDALHAKARQLGFDSDAAPRDEPWVVREFHLHHLDGHVFRISSGIRG
jgi:uncharacterized glyoxalase superfamily protein PhnB